MLDASDPNGVIEFRNLLSGDSNAVIAIATSFGTLTMFLPAITSPPHFDVNRGVPRGALVLTIIYAVMTACWAQYNKSVINRVELKTLRVGLVYFFC